MKKANWILGNIRFPTGIKTGCSRTRVEEKPKPPKHWEKLLSFPLSQSSVSFHCVFYDEAFAFCLTGLWETERQPLSTNLHKYTQALTGGSLVGWESLGSAIRENKIWVLMEAGSSLSLLGMCACASAPIPGRQGRLLKGLATTSDNPHSLHMEFPNRAQCGCWKVVSLIPGWWWAINMWHETVITFVWCKEIIGIQQHISREKNGCFGL